MLGGDEECHLLLGGVNLDGEHLFAVLLYVFGLAALEDDFGIVGGKDFLCRCFMLLSLLSLLAVGGWGVGGVGGFFRCGWCGIFVDIFGVKALTLEGGLYGIDALILFCYFIVCLFHPTFCLFDVGCELSHVFLFQPSVPTYIFVFTRLSCLDKVLHILTRDGASRHYFVDGCTQFWNLPL